MATLYLLPILKNQVNLKKKKAEQMTLHYHIGFTYLLNIVIAKSQELQIETENLKRGNVA